MRPAERIAHLPVPPHSVEAEQAVLGALLLDAARCWPLVGAKLSAGSFYRPDHRLIYAAIGEAMRAGAADLVTVDAILARRNQCEASGGFAYLASLARDTAGTANIEHHAGIVRERAARRALIEQARRLEAAVWERPEASAETLIAETERALAAVREGGQAAVGLRAAPDLVRELIDDLDRRREADTGLKVGLADLDELTGGLEGGDLIVLAGRPGMGKTSLLVTVAAHVARERGVAIFSAEMPARQLMRRAVALLGQVSLTRLKVPRRLTDDDWAAISEAASRLADRHLWVDDRGRPSLEHVRAEAIRVNAKSPLGCVLVDYVQLLEGVGKNRYEQLRDVVYGCKALAKELSVPVIVLAQLNRGVESRENRRPSIADLRDSGAIEEAADIVGLLYSEGYYDREFGMPYVLECNVEKNRNGERGQCLWHFDAERSRLLALEQAARLQYRRLVAQSTGNGNREEAP